MTIEAIGAVGAAGTGTGAGSEWSIPRVEPLGPEGELEAAAGSSGTSFGDVLAKSVGELERMQVEAADQAQKLATGQTSDLTSVVMAAERAQLSMQLASTMRTKAVEAVQEILRTQV